MVFWKLPMISQRSMQHFQNQVPEIAAIPPLTYFEAYGQTGVILSSLTLAFDIFEGIRYKVNVSVYKFQTFFCTLQISTKNYDHAQTKFFNNS